jgi:hypothetical protein
MYTDILTISRFAMPLLQCARFHDLAEFDLERRSCRQRLAEHNRRRRAMTTERKPRESDSYDSADAPNGTTDVSSYHTPSNSTPSYISVEETERAYSLSSLPADVAAAVANLPADFNIDALLAPLASCLHSMNQVAPFQEPLQFPLKQEHPAPLVDMMMSTKPYGSAFNFTGDIAPQNIYIDNAPVEAAAAAAPASAPLNIPGLADDALTMLDGPDIFNDIDLDLALAGILDPVSDPLLPPPPVYTSPDVVVRMSMKFFSCMPSDLPPTLRAELEQSLQINASMVEGYVRPGCTHLTVDLRLPADVAARIESTPLDVILAALAKKLPNNHGLLAQIGKQVAAIKAEKNVGGVIDTSGPRAPHLAALSRVCVSVDEVASTRVDLYGANIGRPGDLVLCRQHGEHVTVEMLETPAWNMVVEEDEEQENNAAIAEINEQEQQEDDDGGSDVENDFIIEDGIEEDDDASATGVLDVDYASSSVRSGTSSTSGWDPSQPRTVKAGCMPAASVRLLGLSCGVAEIEVQTGGVMSAPRPLLVLPDAAAAAEVEQLACRARRAVWMDAFLRDAGVVVAHICSEGAAARLPGEVVEAMAARTSAYCMEAGCPALGRLLRRAQTALRRAIGADDTASKMAEMLEGAAKEKVERHLAATEGEGEIAVEDGSTADEVIPLVENFKGLTVGGSGRDAVDGEESSGGSKGARSGTGATSTQGHGWMSFVSMAVGCVAVAIAAQVFQG